MNLLPYFKMQQRNNIHINNFSCKSSFIFSAVYKHNKSHTQNYTLCCMVQWHIAVLINQ